MAKRHTAETTFLPLKKVSLILLLIILLPALFYSGYEISSLSTSEELMSAMYRQQLDGTLFSLNQYSWDVVTSWANNINALFAEQPQHNSKDVPAQLTDFIRNNRAISAVFVADSALTTIAFGKSVAENVRAFQSSEREIIDTLRAHRSKIDRLFRLQQAEYRKLEPFTLKETPAGEQLLLLVFLTRSINAPQRIVGILLETQAFIRNTLQPKLVEAAGEEFILAVMSKRSQSVFSSTASVSASEIKQQRALWLFPDYFLGIRLKGATIEELVEARFYRNLALIILLDVVLVIGAWIVYRTIRREMELIRLKSDFVSNVSHELRTPLALIRMFTETLEMKHIKTEKKKHEYYRTIIQETERLSRLINNILDFSNMEAGKKQYQFRTADLNTLITDVLDVYSFHVRNKGFALSLKLDNSIPPLQADSEAIKEALHNVLDNAMKYSDNKKRIEVRTGQLDGRIFVEVQDHGIGIAPEYHKKIFEKFFRVSDGLVHTKKGSGLGLTLVQHIVATHKGTINVKSAPGAGSTFRLTFPAVKN